jgi:alkyl hydroperoxide reductase subunit AhpC
LPSLDRLYAEYKSRGFDVLLVNMGEDAEHVRATSKNRGYRMLSVLDLQREVSRAHGVVATPTVYLLDRQGLIVGRAIGMRDWAGPKGRALIEALLRER